MSVYFIRVLVLANIHKNLCTNMTLIHTVSLEIYWHSCLYIIYDTLYNQAIFSKSQCEITMQIRTSVNQSILSKSQCEITMQIRSFVCCASILSYVAPDASAGPEYVTKCMLVCVHMRMCVCSCICIS